jgi:hypothetical protein
VLDLGSLTFQAIFSAFAQQKLRNEGKISEESFVMPCSYLFFMSLISLLKRIGCSKDDIIILAGDGKNSWRKAFDKNYKGQRDALRQKFAINWIEEYQKIGKVINQIDEATDFHIVWISGLWNGLDLINTPEGEKYLNIEDLDLLTEYSCEADDVAAVCCKVFSNTHEIILVTKDADWEMLTTYPNTKFFSMNTKYKGGTGVYKPVDNGYKVLEKKIRLGDVSDNILVDKENDTERDKEIRKLIIDLINLPEFVEKPIRNILNALVKKDSHFEKLPFPRSLALRFPDIYCSKNIITYQESLQRLERKKKMFKNKKAKLKKEKTMRKVQ